MQQDPTPGCVGEVARYRQRSLHEPGRDARCNPGIAQSPVKEGEYKLYAFDKRRKILDGPIPTGSV